VGLRPLNAAEMTSYEAADFDDNVRIDSNLVAAGKPIHSLVINADSVRLTGTTPLSIRSGAVLVLKKTTISGDGSISVPDSTFHTTAETRIEVPLSAGGLAKTGTGTLILSKGGGFGGPVNITAGTLALGTPTTFGRGASITMSGVTSLVGDLGAVVIDAPVSIITGQATFRNISAFRKPVQALVPVTIHSGSYSHTTVFMAPATFSERLIADSLAFHSDTTLSELRISGTSAGELTLAGPTTLTKAGAGVVSTRRLVASAPISGPGGITLGEAWPSYSTSASHTFTGPFVLDVDRSFGSGLIEASADDAFGVGPLTISGDGDLDATQDFVRIANRDPVPHTYHNSSVTLRSVSLGGDGSSDMTFQSSQPLGVLEHEIAVHNNGVKPVTVTFDGPSARVNLVKTGSGHLLLEGPLPEGSATVIAKEGTVSVGYTPDPNRFALTVFGAARSGRLVLLSDLHRGGLVLDGQGIVDLNNRRATIGSITFGFTNIYGYGVQNPDGAGTIATGEQGLLTLGSAGQTYPSSVRVVQSATDTALISGHVNIAAAVASFDVANGTKAVDLNVSAAVHGPGGLVKDGTGTLVLSGRNTYGGPTKLAGGTLALLNSNLPDTPLTIATGTTLAGVGHIVPAVSLPQGATLSPGYIEATVIGAGAAGTLSTGPLTLSAGSRLLLDLSARGQLAGGNDLLIVNGDLVLDGTLTVQRGAGFAAGEYPFLLYTGSLLDNGLSVTDAAFEYALDTSTPGRIVLNVTAVPEASAGALLAMLAALLPRRGAGRLLK
jgi:fibronectin-binding autotransporter adhesin